MNKIPTQPMRFAFVLIPLVWLCLAGALHAQSFGNVSMGGGGYVTGIITCPTQTNLVYCKTDVGGAYRWDEPSQSWIPLLDWNSQNETTYQGVESLAVDPQTPSKLYILAGTSYWNGGTTAILRSSDYGNTFAITDVTAKFKAHGNGSDRQKGESLAVDPNLGSILFCGSRANGLFKSTDFGATWNFVSSLSVGSASISFVKFDPVSGIPGTATPRILVGVLTTGTNLFVSNDAGVTWTPLTNSPSASLPQHCALAGDRNLYITYGYGANGSIMKYNLTNGIWSNCTPQSALTYCGISVCATNPLKLIASTYAQYATPSWGFGDYGDLIFVSNNGGTTWTNLFGAGKISMNANGFPWIVGKAIHWAGALEMDPFNPDRVFVGSGNGIFCTTNLNSALTTSTWKFMVKGLEETVPLNFISVPGGPFITSIGDYGGFIHTNINNSPPTNMSQSYSFGYATMKSNFVARVVYNGELYYSKQFPVTFATKMPSTPGVMTNGYVAISADGSTVLWKSKFTADTCYLTTNLGTNWTLSTGLTFTCIPVADPVNPAKFYAYNSSDGFLYVSTNAGTNFSASGSVGTGGSLTFRAAPGFEGHLWVALGGNGLKYSTNSGATFFSGNINTCDAIALGKTAPGATYPTLFIWGKPISSSIAGMYKSTDKGATWVRVNDDAHEYGGRGNAGLIEGDKNVHGRVYMSSAGRGAVYMDSDVLVTNVTLSPAIASTYVNGTRQLTASVLPANATYPSVTWASSNSAIATVSAAGLVTGILPGTTTITATALDGGFVASGIFTVTNLPQITVTANNVSRAYGTTNPTFTYNLSGFVNGDTAAVVSGSPTLTSGANTNSSVGSYIITNTLGTLSATNYTFALVNGTLSVTTAVLRVTANNAAKTYDRTGYAGGNGVSYSGFVNSETPAALGGTLSYSGTSQGATNVGSYTINPSGLMSANYAITYTNGTLTVNPLGVTVTADAKMKVYRSGDPLLTYTFAPALASGDSFSGTLTRTAGESVGNYAINQGTLSLSGNYALSYVGTNLTITPASLAITANNASKTYGQNLTFAGTEFIAVGLTNADSVTSVTLTSAGATNTAAVNSYPIVPSAAVGSGLGNYILTYNNGTLTVNAATRPVAQNIVVSGGTATITLSGTTGVTYVTQSADDVSGGWTNISTNTPGVDGIWIVNASATASQKFYRALIP